MEYVDNQYVNEHTGIMVLISVMMPLILCENHLDNVVWAVYIHHYTIFQAMLLFFVAHVGCVVHHVVSIFVYMFKSIYVMLLVTIVGKSPFIITVTLMAYRYHHVSAVWEM